MRIVSSTKAVTGTLQVKKIAGSLCLRITDMSKFLKLAEGDWVRVQIEKLEDAEE